MPKRRLAKMSTNDRALAARIFGQRRILQRTLNDKGEAIHKLWRGYNKSQRKEKLTRAGPSLPAHHRPDVEAFNDGRKANLSVLGVPFMNIHDLLNGDNLTALLNSRGRNQPHELVHADFEASTFLWNVGAKSFSRSVGTAMQLHRQTDAETYGNLVAVDVDFFSLPDRAIFRKSGLYRPEVGRQIMQHQSYILEFLVNISNDIVSDLVKPIPNETVDWEASLSARVYDSLGEFSTATSYEKPCIRHLTRLNEIVKSERDLKEDQIWALREDPGVFCERLKDEIEHDWKMKQDGRGRCIIRPLNYNGDSTAWATAAKQMIKDTYVNFALFDKLSILGEKFVDLAQNYDSTQWQNTAIPRELLEVYGHLKYILHGLEMELTQQLRLGLAMSPPLRHKIEIKASYTLDDENPTLVFDGVEVLGNGFGVVKLMKLLSALYDHTQLSAYPMHILMDAVENLVEENPACHKLLSSWITIRLSTLSVVAEYLYQLNRFHPWTIRAGEELETIGKEIQADFSRKHGPRWDMSDCSEPNQLPTLRQLADPSGNKFHYPIEKPRCQETVDACRKAEAALGKFWTKFDLRICNNEGESFCDLVADLLEQDRTVQRTPAWSNRKPPKSQVLTLRLVGLPPAEPRRKKATPDPHAQQDPEPPADDNLQIAGAPEPDSNAVFVVDQRAKAVLDALFHSSTTRNRDRTGEISWKDFKHTMSQVGFSGCKLRGSVWNFIRQGDDISDKVSINFHGPHPWNKCSLHLVRDMGRRLARRLGWTGEMFEVSK